MLLQSRCKVISWENSVSHMGNGYELLHQFVEEFSLRSFVTDKRLQSAGKIAQLRKELASEEMHFHHTCTNSFER